MPGENIQDWSATAASNDTADSSINWREGMARAAVNDSARSMMAAHAKDRNLQNGSITTGGTANAQTFTSGVGYTTSVPSGLRVLLKIGPTLTNTGAATLNMDTIADTVIKNQQGTDLVAGMLTAGGYAEFRYDGTNWILLGFSGALPSTTVTGTLGISGNTTIGGTLAATGATSLNGGLAVTGNATVSGNLTAANIFGTTEFLSGAGQPASGFNGALKITCRGDGAQYGMIIRCMLDNGLNVLFTNSVDVGCGSIANDSGVTTLYNTTSDGDLKTAVADLPPGTIIDDLRPVKFRWKDRPEAGDRTGFIAQEVYHAMPQAVTPARDGKPWMMDYSKLVPVLVAELKSLRKRVAELEAK